MPNFLNKKIAVPVLAAVFFATAACATKNRESEPSPADVEYFEKLIQVGKVPLPDGSILTGVQEENNPNLYKMGFMKDTQWVQCGVRGDGNRNYELTGDMEIQDQGTTTRPPFKYETNSVEELLQIAKSSTDIVPLPFNRRFPANEAGQLGPVIEMSRKITDTVCAGLASKLGIRTARK